LIKYADYNIIDRAAGTELAHITYLKGGGRYFDDEAR
jgi:hypothetical protein